jgi:hypothetical protein
MIRLVTHDGHGPGWLVQAGMDDGLMGDELARGDVSPHAMMGDNDMFSRRCS